MDVDPAQKSVGGRLVGPLVQRAVAGRDNRTKRQIRIVADLLGEGGRPPRRGHGRWWPGQRSLCWCRRCHRSAKRAQRPGRSQTRPRYNGAEDNLTLPVDLSTRKTSFATDSLAAYVPAGVIGTDEITANGTASVTWTGLQPATSYAWVVEARTADGGVAVAQPAVFRTAKGIPTVTATSTPVAWGTAAKVTVTVDAAPAPVTGTVTLREGDTVRGSAALAGGTATFTLPVGLAGGTHALTASYSGSDLLTWRRARSR